MTRDTLLRRKTSLRLVPGTKRTTSLDLALELFLTAKEAKRISPRTLETYRWALDKFTSWLVDHNVGDIDSITAHHIRLYLVGLEGQGWTAWTVHDHMRPVKTWLRFLYREDLLPADLMAKVEMPKPGQDIEPAFAPADVKKLLAACLTARDTALVLFLLDTGVRASELCALTLGDVNLKSGAVTIEHGKGDKKRVAFLGAKARKVLLKYLLTRPETEPDAPLFPNTTTGQPMLRNGLLLWCRRMGKRAGIDNCHPHTFRRTFALWSLRAGMNIYALQQIMGHSDLTVLRRYLALVEEDLADAHRKHGAVDNML